MAGNTGETEIRAEVLWNNPLISSPTHLLHRSQWKSWIRAGITQIHHICHPTENRILGHEEISRRYNFKCNFLDALSIRSSIPFSWRSELSRAFQGDISLKHERIIKDKKIDIFSSSPKRWYSEWVLQSFRSFSRDESWKKELATHDPQVNLDWPSIHTMPYKTTRDTKIQSFAFRIQYRMIPCNKHLHTMRIKQSPTCSTCDMEDSISHFFVACANTQRFWDSLNSWCENHIDVSLSQLSLTELLLGVHRSINAKRVVNWLLLQAKFFIQKNKLFHGGQLPLIAFLAETRAKLYTEQRACLLEGRPNKFRIWHSLFNALG